MVPFQANELPSKTLVIVDDNEELAEVLRDYFSSVSFEAVINADIDFCAETLRTHPSVLLLDYMHPKMSGLDYLRILNEMKVQHFTLVLTGEFNLDWVALYDQGAQWIIHKPIPLELLRAFVENTLILQGQAGSRKWARMPLQLEAAFVGRELKYDGKLLNLSRGGCCVEMMEQYPEQQDVGRLSLRHPDSKSLFDVRSRKVWQKDNVSGFEFLIEEPHEKSDLMQFIAFSNLFLEDSIN